MGFKDFSAALRDLKTGARICRSGWNGKGMFLFLVDSGEWDFQQDPDNMLDTLQRAPFIVMKTADDKVVPWLASQTDILATDWEVVA